jgi:hypothetical protein
MLLSRNSNQLTNDRNGSDGNPELITNGGYGELVAGDWTLAGTDPPTITGNQIVFAGNGGSQAATQVLAAGSQPAGSYDVAIDMPTNGDVLTCILLGAGNENRGSFLFASTGPQDTVINATGEVTSIRLLVGTEIAATVSMVSLKASE